MPPTGPWTLKNGKVPGQDSWRRARELKPNSHVRFTPGDTLEGNGIDLRSILQKKDVGFADSHEARSIFSPQDYGFEQDPNIIWIQNPTRTFQDEQGAQFSQLQSIIRDRLRNLNYDYAVVRAGPHCTQNQHDELGTVLRCTNGWTGRDKNLITEADPHITLYVGKRRGQRGEELLLQGHIYLEKVQQNKEDPDEWHYSYLADATKRQYPKPGEPPASEEWWLTANTHKKTW